MVGEMWLYRVRPWKVSVCVTRERRTETREVCTSQNHIRKVKEPHKQTLGEMLRVTKRALPLMFQARERVRKVSREALTGLCYEADWRGQGSAGLLSCGSELFLRKEAAQTEKH